LGLKYGAILPGKNKMEIEADFPYQDKDFIYQIYLADIRLFIHLNPMAFFRIQTQFVDILRVLIY
jgi:hypothetical protein